MNKFIVLAVIIVLIVIGLGAYLPINPSHPTQLPISHEDSCFGFIGGEDFEDMRALGAGWYRPHPGPLNWDAIERESGEYDWSKTDEYVKKAQNYGFRTLATIWPFNDRDQLICHSDEPTVINDEFAEELASRRYKPCDMEAYSNFVRAMVERYNGDGVGDMPGLQYGIKYWEVSNEPSMQETPLTFFQGTPANYFDILQTTYTAVKTADPGAKVLYAGMAGAGGEVQDFWENVFFDIGADNYFDIANIHIIGFGDEETLNTAWLRNLLSSYNTDKPIWVTEAEILGVGRSDEEHAEVLVKGYVGAFGNGTDKVFYTTFRTWEKPGEKGGSRESALIDAGGKKRPAYYALETLIKKIDCFTSVEKLAEGQYKFVAENKPVYVLWGAGSLPPEISGTVKVTDISGNEQQMDVSQITLNDSPIYVE
jgi:hypothetical protein